MRSRAVLSIRLRLCVLAILAAAALPCFATEVAVLKNGFSIRHERREVVGDTTRLYVSADGSSFVDVPTAEIEHFEAAPEESKTPLVAKNSRTVALSASVFPATSVFSRSNAVNLNDVVQSASGRYRLDPDLVNSVIKAESGFNARAVSPKGAQGLMQLMPGTASQLGVPNAFDPQANVEGGTKYLRELLERYNFDLVKALAAYNAGPQRVEQFGGVPPYYETRAYVARVVRDFNKKKAAEEKATPSSSPKTAASKHASAKTDSSAGKTQKSPLVQAKTNTAQTTQ
jgi:soluble lytic murein transglycosylase-like protein